MTTPENPTPQPEGWGQPAPGAQPPSAPAAGAPSAGVPNPTDFLPAAVTGQISGRPATMAGLALMVIIAVEGITSFLDFVDAEDFEDAFLDRLNLLLGWGNTGMAIALALAVTMFAFSTESNSMRKLGLTLAMIAGFVLGGMAVLSSLVSLGLEFAEGIDKLSLFITDLATAALAFVCGMWAGMLAKSTK